MVDVPKILIHEERTRGRSNSNSKSLKSIVLISRKFGLDPELLIDALMEAWRKNIHHYGCLKVSCRGMRQDRVIFLLTSDDEVVSQFHLKSELLEDADFFKNQIENIPISHYGKMESFQKQKRISELRFGMKRVDVVAKIVEVPPKKLVTTKLGNQSYVSNVRIKDETGTIRLSLWNSQIDLVKVGDRVEVKDCYVSNFAGEPQLRIGRNGTISVIV